RLRASHGRRPRGRKLSSHWFGGAARSNRARRVFMRVSFLLFLGCLCVGVIGGDLRADEPRSQRTDPDILKTLHPTFADQTDEALLKLVKKNPGLVIDMDSSECTALHYAARYGKVET